MRAIRGIVAAGLFCLMCSVPAAAQTPSTGPLVLQPVRHGFLIAPDVKVTTINSRTETLVGAYAAYVHDSHLLFGGAGYWQATGNGARELSYGGLTVGWIAFPDNVFNITAKGLIGGGWIWQHNYPVYGYGQPKYPYGYYGYHGNSSFFVFEPEVDVHVRVSQLVAVTVGGSYRIVDSYGGYDDFANGPTASVSVQFRFGG